jgi:hypothetical protein
MYFSPHVTFFFLNVIVFLTTNEHYYYDMNELNGEHQFSVSFDSCIKSLRPDIVAREGRGRQYVYTHACIGTDIVAREGRGGQYVDEHRCSGTQQTNDERP